MARLEADLPLIRWRIRQQIVTYPVWAHDELHSEALVLITEAAVEFRTDDGHEDVRDRFIWFVVQRAALRLASFYRRLTSWNRRTRTHNLALSLNVSSDEHGNGWDKPSELVDLLPAKDGDPVERVLTMERLEELAALPPHLRAAIVGDRQEDHGVSVQRFDQRRAQARALLRGENVLIREPSTLPMKPRVLLWHLSNGKTVEEAALEMGVTRETAKTHLKRARKILRLSGASSAHLVAVAIRLDLIP
jgi:DNA-binding CsgD family transcriptional regulator